MKLKTRALVLFSGGLDSMLAVKILREQNIEVAGLCFASNFFGCAGAEKSAKSLGIELIKLDIHQEMIELVKNPPHGYGKNLNPCIDCHGNMFRIAAGIAREQGFDFIASGEVLGQRPFSQNKQALLEVEKLAGVPVLRPLSAKLLPETEMEKDGLVRRGLLGRIKGRSRQEQAGLAKKFAIKDFPSPAGGCLLTDPGFSARLVKMLDYWPDCNDNDIELLKYGRVFWLTMNNKIVLIVVGRHKEDNEQLDKLAKIGDFMLQLKDINGPSVLLRFKSDQDIKAKEFKPEFKINTPAKLSLSVLKLDQAKSFGDIIAAAAMLCAVYTVKARGQEVVVIAKRL